MTKEKLKPGTIKDHYNIAFISDEQFDQLSLDLDWVDDHHADAFDIMDTQIFRAIQMKLEDQPEEYYLDISVDLENKTFEVHDIYEASYGTYGIVVGESLNNAALPITLPLTDKVRELLKIG